MRIAVIGPAGSGKSTLIESIGLDQQCIVTPNISHSNNRGTATVQCYNINGMKIYDTPGFNDAEAMDDMFAREIVSTKTLQNLDCLIYCFRPFRQSDTRRENQLKYDTVFGKTSVILAIASYPRDSQKSETLRVSQTAVEQNGLTVNSHFFIPDGGATDTPNVIKDLVLRLLQFQNNPIKINFNPITISKLANEIVKMKRTYDASVEDAKPRETASIWCSQGLSNGAEHKRIYDLGKKVISTRKWIYSGGEGHGARCEIRIVGTTAVEIDFRMSDPHHWCDCHFYATIQGEVNEVAKGRLLELQNQYKDLYTDIMNNWEYYSSRAAS